MDRANRILHRRSGTVRFRIRRRTNGPKALLGVVGTDRILRPPAAVVAGVLSSEPRARYAVASGRTPRYTGLLLSAALVVPGAHPATGALICSATEVEVRCASHWFFRSGHRPDRGRL